MNGVNAIIQTWGLGRAASPTSHILVYWISPLIGVWVGLWTLKSLQSLSFMWTLHPPTAVVVAGVQEDTVGASSSFAHSDESTNTSELVGSCKITSGGLQLPAVCGSPRILRSKSLVRDKLEV